MDNFQITLNDLKETLQLGYLDNVVIEGVMGDGVCFVQCMCDCSSKIL